MKWQDILKNESDYVKYLKLFSDTKNGWLGKESYALQRMCRVGKDHFVKGLEEIFPNINRELMINSFELASGGKYEYQMTRQDPIETEVLEKGKMLRRLIADSKDLCVKSKQDKGKNEIKDPKMKQIKWRMDNLGFKENESIFEYEKRTGDKITYHDKKDKDGKFSEDNIQSKKHGNISSTSNKYGFQTFEYDIEGDAEWLLERGGLI